MAKSDSASNAVTELKTSDTMDEQQHASATKASDERFDSHRDNLDSAVIPSPDADPGALWKEKQRTAAPSEPFIEHRLVSQGSRRPFTGEYS